MARGIALAPPRWREATTFWQRMLAHPQSVNRILLVAWFATRAILLANLVLGQHYADPAFYNYAGDLTLGRFPYLNYPVEYPPLAMLFLLLPALPLLPFPGLAPHPVPELNGPSNLILNLPDPNPIRYGAYGLSFAVEMLIIDVVTLWLIRVSARRLFARREAELSAGLIYLLIVFVSGALLQKFDLAVGMLALGALLALWSGRTRTAWLLLALDVLMKGFPILLVPIFAIALAQRSAPTTMRDFVARLVRALLQGALWCGGVVVAATVGIIAWAGWRPVLETITYHSSRGLEVESMYANLALVLGGLPGLEAITPFDADGLSRAVTSPITPTLVAASTAVMALAILVVYLAYARSVLRHSLVPLVRRSTRHSLESQADAGAILNDAVVSEGESSSAERAPGTQPHPAAANTSLATTVDANAAGGPTAPPWAEAALLASLGLLLAFLATFRALPAHYLLDVVPLVPLVAPARRRLAAIWTAGPLAFALCGGVIIMVWNAFLAQEPWAVALMTLRNLGWLATLVLVVSALWYGSAAEGTARVRAAPSAVGACLGRWRARWTQRVIQTPPIPGFRPRGEDVFAHALASVGAVPLLIGAGVSSLCLYAVLLVAFPLTRWFQTVAAENGRPAAHAVGPLTQYSPLAALGFALFILALFVLQFLALLAVTRIVAARSGGDEAKSNATRLWGVRGGILLFPALAAALLVWMQPITSTSLYGYVARGYGFALLGQNPLITHATLLPGGLRYNAATDTVGPLWLLVSWCVAHLAGQQLLLSMLLFKVALALCMIGAIVVVDALAGRYFPAWRLRIDVLFGWSPLLLFETVANGHDEIVVALFVLLAVVCLARGWVRLGFVGFVVAAMVNVVGLLFLPLWLVYALPRRDSASREPTGGATGGGPHVPRSWRPRRGELTRATGVVVSAFALGVVVVVLCFAPFWIGWHTVAALAGHLHPATSQGSLVALIVSFTAIFATATQAAALANTIKLLFGCVFVTYFLTQCYLLWRQPHRTVLALLTTAAKIVFVGLVSVAFAYQSWYVIFLLPLAALATEPFVRRAAQVLAISSLLAYAVNGYLLVNQQGVSRNLVVQSVEVLIIFAPLLFLRAAPYEGGVVAIARRYLSSVEWFLRGHTRRQEQAMLTLVLIVAAMLRLLRLGNLLSPITGVGSSSDALAEVSGNLHLVLSDPRGLSLPFILTYQAIVAVFGPTPLAILLPSAILGTLTVYVIYLLTREIMRQGGYRASHLIGILAALLAATSNWHVALSRSGMEVVVLPLLMCTALYWLLQALRLSGMLARFAATSVGRSARERRLRRAISRRAVGAGICTGLACDLAPGLWVLPFLVIGILVVWRWRLPSTLRGQRGMVLRLLGSAIVAGFSAIGYFGSQVAGLPPGSPIFARSSVVLAAGPGPLSGQFWAQVASNLGTVLQLLITQDYSAAYPAVGGAPIIPALLTPVFVLGLILLVLRWRNPASLALLLLLAMPIAASIAVGTPPSVIAAASVLPAICIVPALALFEVFNALGHLPIVLDRVSGTRIFTTPQQIGRVLLLVFLLASTVRTFFWYFEATLPAAGTAQNATSSIGDSTALTGADQHTGHDALDSTMQDEARAFVLVPQTAQRGHSVQDR